LLISNSSILSPSHSLLSSPLRESHPEWTNLSLAAERLSGELSNPRWHQQLWTHSSLSVSTINHSTSALCVIGGSFARSRKSLLSLLEILTFLAHATESRLIFINITLNISRSAISLISDSSIGNHSVIKHFYKGVSILKSQKPRYDFIWDLALVISKLASVYPYDSLPLEIIRKLILLLALGSG